MWPLYDRPVVINMMQERLLTLIENGRIIVMSMMTSQQEDHDMTITVTYDAETKTIDITNSDDDTATHIQLDDKGRVISHETHDHGD